MHGRIAHRMGLHGTGKHYFAIAGGLNNGAPAQQGAQAASHQQVTITTTCVPHDCAPLSTLALASVIGREHELCHF